jgi:anti-sigma factor RsiW
MTDPKIPVTEDELHAYVDNELPAERRGDVEAWLTARPEDAARVQSWRAMAEALHARYDPWSTSGAEAARDRAAGAPASQMGLRRDCRDAGGVRVRRRCRLDGARSGGRPSAMQNFTLEALEAHRLYVVEVRHPVEVPAANARICRPG